MILYEFLGLRLYGILFKVQVEYLATAEGLQEAANAAAAVEYIGIEQGAAAALIDESGNLIHSAR